MNANVYLMEQNVIQINEGITMNVDASVKNICEKNYVANFATCNCENRKYLASISCDEVIESYVKEIHFNEKKAICKTQNFYILLGLLLITIALLIAVSIYCYLIKY